jgi:hypothetical protein
MRGRLTGVLVTVLLLGADSPRSGRGETRVEVPIGSQWEMVWGRKGNHEQLWAFAKFRKDGTVSIQINVSVWDVQGGGRSCWLYAIEATAETLSIRPVGRQLRVKLTDETFSDELYRDGRIPPGDFCLRFRRVK